MLGLLLLAAAAHDGGYFASSASTSQLARICSENAVTDLTADFCTGYIMAVHDTLSVNGRICPGPGASTIQLVAVGRKYIADHPELWSKQPAFVLAQAFRTAFPCDR